MKKRRIAPGWRYTLAQKALTLLFGRKWHHISPWKEAGLAACMLPVHQGKVLLAQRTGAVEFAGCWSDIGGFLDIQNDETFAQAAAREFREETGLQLESSAFPPVPDFTLLAFHQDKHEATDKAVAGVYFVFEAPADLPQRLNPQEETSAFGWFTEEECRTMLATGELPADFTDFHEALWLLFARLKGGWRPPALPLAQTA